MALYFCVTFEDGSHTHGPDIVAMVKLALQGAARQIHDVRPKIDARLPLESCLFDAFEHPDRVGILALASDDAYLTQLCLDPRTSELASNT